MRKMKDVHNERKLTSDEEVGNLPDDVHPHARQEEIHERRSLAPRLDGWRLDQLPPARNSRGHK